MQIIFFSILRIGALTSNIKRQTLILSASWKIKFSEKKHWFYRHLWCISK